MQRYFSNQKDKDTFILNDDDIYHIKKVMRMQDKDKIEVVYTENVYECCISNVNTNIKINIIKKLNINTDLPIEIVLALPLLKEQKMDYIFQKATELGVNKFIPIIVERSIIKLDESKVDK